MELVIIDGKLTIEETDSTLYLFRQDMAELASIGPMDDEIAYYRSIQASVNSAWEKVKDEATTRRFVILNPECITLIQFLLGREERKMLAYLRSCSGRKVFSDLGFLSRLAQQFSVDVLTVHFGSFHVELES